MMTVMIQELNKAIEWLRQPINIRKAIRTRRARAEVERLSSESGIYHTLPSQSDGRCPICGVSMDSEVGGVCWVCGVGVCEVSSLDVLPSSGERAIKWREQYMERFGRVL